jgi:hypothetical protein
LALIIQLTDAAICTISDKIHPAITSRLQAFTSQRHNHIDSTAIKRGVHLQHPDA